MITYVPHPINRVGWHYTPRSTPAPHKLLFLRALVSVCLCAWVEESAELRKLG
jgi:hypothetical protein